MTLDEDTLARLQLLKSQASNELCLRRSIIRLSSNYFLTHLLTLLLHFLRGRFDLNRTQFSAFKKRRNLLFQICQENETLSAKRRLLMRKRSLNLISHILGVILPQLEASEEWKEEGAVEEGAVEDGAEARTGGQNWNPSPSPAHHQDV
jgi:hypothetical protein